MTDLALDQSSDRLRLNFNITMMDMPCKYATIDTRSLLGTEQNVTAHVNKWDVDAKGVRQRYQGRNKQQKDIELFDADVQETIEELHREGVDAVDLDAEGLELARRNHEYLFVDFFASWYVSIFVNIGHLVMVVECVLMSDGWLFHRCSHCRALAPTWEILAEAMTAAARHIVDEGEHKYSDEDYKHAVKVELPVLIAKVDCVQHDLLCRQQQIMAYPTLRLFVDGERWKGGDYNSDRTVIAMADYLKEIEDLHKNEEGKTASGKKAVEIAHESKLVDCKFSCCVL